MICTAKNCTNTTANGDELFCQKHRLEWKQLLINLKISETPIRTENDQIAIDHLLLKFQLNKIVIP